MNTKDIIRYEFIGIHATIIGAKNKSLVGLKGTIVDETKNTFVLDIGDKEKTILKEQATLMVTINGKTYKIDGLLLVGRPEDRLKKKIKL